MKLIPKLLPEWMADARDRHDEAHELRRAAEAAAVRAEMNAAASKERARRNGLSHALDQLWTRSRNA